MDRIELNEGVKKGAEKIIRWNLKLKEAGITTCYECEENFLTEKLAGASLEDGTIIGLCRECFPGFFPDVPIEEVFDGEKCIAVKFAKLNLSLYEKMKKEKEVNV